VHERIRISPRNIHVRLVTWCICLIEPELNLPTAVLLVFVVLRTSLPPGPDSWFREQLD